MSHDMQPPTLQDVLSLAETAASSGANAVHHMTQISQALRNLPPAAGEILTQPKWRAASLWSYAANVQNLAPNQEKTAQIRLPAPVWMRGVVTGVIPVLAFGTQTPSQVLEAWQLIRQQASNYRSLIEVSWRLNGRQGWVSTGTGEAQAAANTISGDGTYLERLDWKLEREDTIDVRIRNVSNRLVSSLPGEAGAGGGFTLAMVNVVFWAQKLLPSGLADTGSPLTSF